MSNWLMAWKNECQNTLSDCVLSPPLRVLWKRKFKTYLYLPICVDQGRVFIRAENGDSSYAIDSTKNRVIWKHSYSATKDIIKFGEHLFVGGYPSSIIDSKSGKTVYEFNFIGEFAIYKDGYIYLPANFHPFKRYCLVRINCSDYQNIEELYCEEGKPVAHVVISNNRIMYYCNKYLLQLNYETKTLCWRVRLSDDYHKSWFGHISVVDDRIYINSSEGLRILDIYTAKEILFIKYLKAVMPLSPACIDNNSIYACNHYVYKINTVSGQIEWTFKNANESPNGMIIVSGNTLYFGNYTGMVFALNKMDGKVLWSYQTEGKGQIVNCLAVADDKLFVGNSMGYFYCFVEDK